jgi:hypothetical protein
LERVGLFEQNKPSPNVKIVIFRKYSFERLIQSSQGNNALDPAASNTDGFLQRDTCIPSTLPNRPTWSNRAYDLQENFLSKTNSIVTWKQCARCCTF